MTKTKEMIQLVSIIMPAYNSERFIAESIESVLAQTYPHWELIVIDDGSNDSTASIIKEYSKNDSRIKYYYQENQKQGRARNNGISKSNGDWIAFLDHDDLWAPEKLAKQVEFINNNNVDLVFSDGYIFNSSDKNTDQAFQIKTGFYKGNDALKLFLQCNRIPMLSVLVSKNAIDACGGFEEHPDIQNADDYLLWLRMLAKGFSFYGMPDKLVYYRLHENQASGNDPYNHEQAINIFNSFFDAPPALTTFYKQNKLNWYKNWYCRIADNKSSASKILNSLVKMNSIKIIAFITTMAMVFGGLKFSKKVMQKLILLKIKIQYDE